MIYRNSLFANHVTWTVDDTPEAAEVVRTFLRSEYELLRIARVAPNTAADLQAFLELSAALPLIIERSAAGELLVRAEAIGESLMITGKTAEVLCSYIDRQIVRMQDRADMTLHRQVSLSA